MYVLIGKPSYHMDELDPDWAPSILIGFPNNSHVQRSQRHALRRSKSGALFILILLSTYNLDK